MYILYSLLIIIGRCTKLINEFMNFTNERKNKKANITIGICTMYYLRV